MSPQQPPDEWTEGSESYVYRDGSWTTPTGYCLSTARGQELTLKFYERYGRVPYAAPAAQPARRRTRTAPQRPGGRPQAGTRPTAGKPESMRAALVKAAVARAKSSSGSVKARRSGSLDAAPAAQTRVVKSTSRKAR